MTTYGQKAVVKRLNLPIAPQAQNDDSDKSKVCTNMGPKIDKM